MRRHSEHRKLGNLWTESHCRVTALPGQTLYSWWAGVLVYPPQEPYFCCQPLASIFGPHSTASPTAFISPRILEVWMTDTWQLLTTKPAQQQYTYTNRITNKTGTRGAITPADLEPFDIEQAINGNTCGVSEWLGFNVPINTETGGRQD